MTQQDRLLASAVGSFRELCNAFREIDDFFSFWMGMIITRLRICIISAALVLPLSIDRAVQNVD